MAREDRAAIGRANGVGPKLAQRIVIELRGKPLSGPILSGVGPTTPEPPSGPGGAVAALLGLGIPEVSARRVVDQAALRLGEDAGEAALIKAALRELGR